MSGWAGAVLLVAPRVASPLANPSASPLPLLGVILRRCHCIYMFAPGPRPPVPVSCMAPGGVHLAESLYLSRGCSACAFPKAPEAALGRQATESQVTIWGSKNSNGMRLKLVYRAENLCRPMGPVALHGVPKIDFVGTLYGSYNAPVGPL